MKVTIYALGGGNGHFVRGFGVATAFAARGDNVRLLLPDRFRASARFSTQTSVTFTYVAETNATGLAHKLSTELACHPPDVLIVDVFSEGLLGELSSVRKTSDTRTVLLKRLTKQAYAANDAFDVVVNVEPQLAAVCSDDEISLGPVVTPRAAHPESCEVLIAPTARTKSLVRRLAARLRRDGVDVGIVLARHNEEVAASTNVLPGNFYGAKVVVGPAGYNLTYEAQQAGVHHIALPEQRRFDDQFARAQHCAKVPTSPAELESMVRASLAGAPRPRAEFYSHAALAETIATKLRSRARVGDGFASTRPVLRRASEAAPE